MIKHKIRQKKIINNEVSTEIKHHIICQFNSCCPFKHEEYINNNFIVAYTEQMHSESSFKVLCVFFIISVHIVKDCTLHTLSYIVLCCLVYAFLLHLMRIK